MVDQPVFVQVLNAIRIIL